MIRRTKARQYSDLGVTTQFKAPVLIAIALHEHLLYLDPDVTQDEGKRKRKEEVLKILNLYPYD